MKVGRKKRGDVCGKKNERGNNRGVKSEEKEAGGKREVG